MPVDDFYRPQDPDALQREKDLLALENRLLRARLGKREEEAGSHWVSTKRFEELKDTERARARRPRPPASRRGTSRSWA